MAPPRGRLPLGSRIELSITALDEKWQGIGHLQDGTEVIVPAVFPGDRAIVRIDGASNHRRRLFGMLLELKSPSGSRRTSFCGIFPRCYGCPGAPLDYQEQLRLKSATLTALFAAAGPVRPSPAHLGYRSKTKWVGQGAGDDYRLGGYIHNSHEVVALPECPVTHPAIMACHAPVLEVVRTFEPFNDRTGTGFFRAVFLKRVSSGELLLTFVLSRRPDVRESDAMCSLGETGAATAVTMNIHPEVSNVLTGPEEEPLFGPSHLLETDHAVPYPVNATAFSQINHGTARLMYERLREWAGAGLDSIVDLYAGNGPIALSLSGAAQTVVAIERSPHAVAMGNAMGSPVRFIGETIGEGSSTWDVLRRHRPDLVTVNPPRAGLAPALVDQLCQSGVPRIAYMSCNPRTLRRDADAWSSHYQAVNVEGYDMFPHTPHFETLAFFEKRQRR